MKKRVLCALLATILVFNFCAARPKAEAAVAAVITIGMLACKLLGVMTGQYDDIANAMGDWFEDIADDFENAYEMVDEHWGTGWNQICSTISGWIDDGSATLDNDGKLTITYEQYLELYSQVIGVMATPAVEFQADYNYYFLDVDLSTPLSLGSLPRFDEFFAASEGQSYAPVYFNDDMLVFGRAYINQRTYNTTNYAFNVFDLYGLSKNSHYTVGGLTASNQDSYATFVSTYSPVVWVRGNYAYQTHHSQGLPDQTNDKEIDSCYMLSNGSLTLTPIADIDFSNLNAGMVTTIGYYGEFLKTVTGYQPTVIEPELDDLADVLPLDKTTNPTLVIDSDPSIVLPTDAVTVTDVPGVADATLTDYMAEVDTDIDIPSIIVEKFPFCIPFDFIRILSVLCADPISPVFRIPLSTNPDNVSDYKGNQTFGEYLPDEDFVPMFELDEEIVIDLSVLPLVQPICYTIFIVGFVVMLVVLTPKLIQH